MKSQVSSKAELSSMVSPFAITVFSFIPGNEVTTTTEHNYFANYDGRKIARREDQSRFENTMPDLLI